MQTLHEYMMATKAVEYLMAVVFLCAGQEQRLHRVRADRCLQSGGRHDAGAAVGSAEGVRFDGGIGGYQRLCGGQGYYHDAVDRGCCGDQSYFSGDPVAGGGGDVRDGRGGGSRGQ